MANIPFLCHDDAVGEHFLNGISMTDSQLDSCGKKSSFPTYVTKPFLPPLKEFIPYLEDIWNTRVLTNRGIYHTKLEEELCKYLGVNYISICSSATTGLLIALKALEIDKEVITTPYSFVATAHSLLWSGIKPVFVDVDPVTLNINPLMIEEAITTKTSAILAVHCYGTPCDVAKIKEIASRRGLKVIYDAAHAFGVESNGGSILNHGDLSIVSFHSTKVFNTLEGGAIISPDIKSKAYIDKLLNFGFEDDTSVISLGLNGKMSEVNAALGLLQLKSIKNIIKKRSIIDALYRQRISAIQGISCLQTSRAWSSNYAYFPIFVESEYPLSRDELYEKLKRLGIHTRKYFYPLITSFPMYKQFSSSNVTNHPVAAKLAAEVLCLPIFPELSTKRVIEICKMIAEFQVNPVED